MANTPRYVNSACTRVGGDLIVFTLSSVEMSSARANGPIPAAGDGEGSLFRNRTSSVGRQPFHFRESSRSSTRTTQYST